MSQSIKNQIESYYAKYEHRGFVRSHRNTRFILEHIALRNGARKIAIRRWLEV